MRHAAHLRREMGIRTIFNLLGPLASPVEDMLEARVVGVTEAVLGPVFAEALRISASKKGALKAMVVRGMEGLDEISCAGATECWWVREREEGKGMEIVLFELQPRDFGFERHDISEIKGGDTPKDNAEILVRLLEGRLDRDDPILEVVLMNAAAMLVVSGICEAETSQMGEGDDGSVLKERGPGGGWWKEGVRRARWAVESGSALQSLRAFTEVSNRLGK